MYDKSALEITFIEALHRRIDRVALGQLANALDPDAD
jgi:hypothetical protein